MNAKLLNTNFLLPPESKVSDDGTKHYHDYLLSEIAVNNNFGISAIEPITKEEICEDSISIIVSYQIFTIPESNHSIPIRFSIMPAMSINSCPDTYDIIEILWKFMPQDLILRYYNNHSSPVWIGSLIKGKCIWIPGYKK